MVRENETGNKLPGIEIKYRITDVHSKIEDYEIFPQTLHREFEIWLK